jgi:glycine/D-amino acid oxidase-like deaminating enzyme
MRVIVVGAGILGASVARSLAVAGEDVLLLDRCGAGTGTTSTTFAWTNANRKLDPDYQRLNVAGMEEHATLARHLGGEQSYFRSGSLHCADAASESWLASNVELLQSLDYPARWVERAEAARVAGDIRIPESTSAVAHFPSEGYVLPERLLQSLLDDAQRHGAKISIGEVATIDDGLGGVSVRLVGGEVHTGDRVVLATGRWTDELAAGAGLDIPMMTDISRGSPIIGLLGYVSSPEIDLHCVVHTPFLNLRPAAGRHIVVQALDLNADVDPTDTRSVDGELSGTIRERLSALTDRSRSPEIDLRIAIRSMPADGLTIAGYAVAESRVYCLVTHSGITLAPLLGRLVAAEITTDQEHDLLRAFRPTRFAGMRRSEITIERPTRLGEQ